jgi:ParB/RepB/Spo0J family partition protein
MSTAIDATTTATVTTATVHELERPMRLQPGQLTPSPTNPRKRFDPARVTQIAESMKQVGQIQPIRARPNPRHTASNGQPPYEIVVGETRWRAAQQANIPLDVIVRSYTDIEALEVQLVENLQRTDLHPMEEAEGYEQLLRTPTGLQGHATVHDLAARVGKSDSYVYQRIKLLALCKAGRDAFYAGQINASVALLIARMPNAEEQARATAKIVAGFGGDPYSYRQAVEYLQREFMLKLQLARFDITAAYKVAGPCAGCKKRSGAEPDLFADVTGGDMCQDARCYQAKTEEAHQLLLQAARDAGRTVLQGVAARRVLPTVDGAPVGHFRLDAPCPELTDSARPLRALLGTGSTAQIVVVDLPDQAPVELVAFEVARTAIKARGLLRQQTSSSKKASPAPAPAPAAPASKANPMPKPTAGAPSGAPAASPPAGGGGEGNKDDAWLRYPELRGNPGFKPAGDEMVFLRFGKLLFDELRAKLETAPELPSVVLDLAINLLANSLEVDEIELLYSGMGWAFDADSLDADFPFPLFDFHNLVRELDGRGKGMLLALLAVVRDCTDSPPRPIVVVEHNRSPALALAGVFGIDLDRVLADARAALEEEQGSAAGAARREPTPTEAFISQHGAAAGGAGTTKAA